MTVFGREKFPRVMNRSKGGSRDARCLDATYSIKMFLSPSRVISMDPLLDFAASRLLFSCFHLRICFLLSEILVDP